MDNFLPIALLAGWLVAAPAVSAPSDVDLSFGVGGVVSFAVPNIVPPHAALQPDGKLIVAATTLQATATNLQKTSWLIRRYAVDGSSDLTFGTNGSVLLSFDLSSGGFLWSDVPNGIALLPDGRFVVAGTSMGRCGPGGGCEAAAIVARFNADGSLDKSFGSGGKAFPGAGAIGAGADDVAVQGDGKVLLFSNISGLLAAYSPYLQRLNVDGTPDPTFSASIGCIGNGSFRLDPDGRIVIVTTLPMYPNNGGFCVTRLDAAGTPDATFGAQGMTTVGAGDSALLRDFLVDASGQILVSGFTTREIVFRLTADGGLDATFGTGGIAPVDSHSFVNAIASDCHARLLVAGEPADDATFFLIARLQPDGRVDPDLAAVPPAPAPLASSWQVTQMLVRPNGRIVAISLEEFSGPPYASTLSIIQYQGDSPCATTAAVEYYYADWNYYFVTAFPDEIAALDGGAFGGAWKRTGENFNVWPQPNASTSPACRFFSTAFAPKSSHFYTPFPAECQTIKTSAAWQFESVAFYLEIPTGYGTGNGFCPAGTIALYRAYNNGMGGAPNHRYTTSLATLNAMIAMGWSFEGETNTKVFACVPQ